MDERIAKHPPLPLSQTRAHRWKVQLKKSLSCVYVWSRTVRERLDEISPTLTIAHLSLLRANTYCALMHTHTPMQAAHIHARTLTLFQIFLHATLTTRANMCLLSEKPEVRLLMPIFPLTKISDQKNLKNFFNFSFKMATAFEEKKKIN